MLRRTALWVWSLVVACAMGYYFGRAAGIRSHGAATPPQSRERTVDTRQSPPPTAGTGSEQGRISEAREKAAEVAIMRSEGIGLPIRGLKSTDILDTFHQSRGEARTHEATDIMAPRGTPVLAVVTGTIKKLFESKPGGLTLYQFDAAEKYCYYYAHLDGYAPGIKEGDIAKQGEIIGYVGSTGNADPKAPHLHFAIFELGPEKKWHEGTPVNPYPLLIRAVPNSR